MSLEVLHPGMASSLQDEGRTVISRRVFRCVVRWIATLTALPTC